MDDGCLESLFYSVFVGSEGDGELFERAAARLLEHADVYKRQGDERVRGVAFAGEFVDATEEDWGREYLALEISVKVVGGIDEAIAHVNLSLIHI